MKKVFLIIAIVLTAILVLGIALAVGDAAVISKITPWLSDNVVGIYCAVTVLCWFIAFWKYAMKVSYIMVVVLSLFSIFFLAKSVMMMADTGSNWYLPLALGLNAIAQFIRVYADKKEKRVKIDSEL